MRERLKHSNNKCTLKNKEKTTSATSYLLEKNRHYAQVLAEYNNGNLDASYVYGLDLISQERNNVDSYYLVDGLGSNVLT